MANRLTDKTVALPVERGEVCWPQCRSKLATLAIGESAHEVDLLPVVNGEKMPALRRAQD